MPMYQKDRLASLQFFVLPSCLCVFVVSLHRIQMKSLVRRTLLFGFIAAVAGAIILGLRPAAVEADLAKVVRGEIRETVDQDGKTRLRERYTVSAPLAGRLLRI